MKVTDNNTSRLSCRANEQTAKVGTIHRSISNPAPRQTSRSADNESGKSIPRNVLQNNSPRLTSYIPDNNLKNVPNHKFQMHRNRDEETDITDDIGTIIDDSSTKYNTSGSNFSFPSSSSVKIIKSGKDSGGDIFLNSNSVKIPRNVPREECSLIVMSDGPQKKISQKHRDLLLMTERAKIVENADDSGKCNNNYDVYSENNFDNNNGENHNIICNDHHYNNNSNNNDNYNNNSKNNNNNDDVNCNKNNGISCSR